MAQGKHMISHVLTPNMTKTHTHMASKTDYKQLCSHKMKNNDFPPFLLS